MNAHSHHITTATPETIHCRSILVSLLTMFAALSAVENVSAAASSSERAVPKVVVNILVDQLRTDYMQAFMPLYGDGGLRRLMNEGRVYAQAEYPHYSPDRASAAASLSTGASPRHHGIVGQTWLDRQTLRPVSCVADATREGISTLEKVSPVHLGTSTVGDELKVATDGAAFVYAIAPTPDAAILSAGHAADLVIWIDDLTGRWCTTNYYSPTLPTWVNVQSSESLAHSCDKITWKPTNELVGNFSYFLSQGMRKPFEHNFKGSRRIATFKTSGLVNDEVSAAAARCLQTTQLGQDAITDYLSVTLYAGSFDHRPVSEVSMELQDTYVRLDAAVARLLDAVEKKVGLENALVVLTSTGTQEEESSDLSKFRIPTGTLDVKRTAALLGMYLTAVYGQGKYVEAAYGTQLYLNHKLIEDKQINLAEMLERAQDFLLQLSGVKDVYTSQRLIQGAWTPGISNIRNGYHARTSGDILIEVMPGWRYVNEDIRENHLVRETYIPFPIIFFGYGIAADVVETPVTTDYVAPTLSQAMRIRAPNACQLKPLSLSSKD